MIVGYINQDRSFLFDIIYYKSLNTVTFNGFHKCSAHCFLRSACGDFTGRTAALDSEPFPLRNCAVYTAVAVAVPLVTVTLSVTHPSPALTLVYIFFVFNVIEN